MDWDTILKTMRKFEGLALFEYENVENVEEGLRKSYQYVNERWTKINFQK